MKKALLIFAICAVVLGGICLWLASGASPENAPQEIQTITLDAP